MKVVIATLIAGVAAAGLWYAYRGDRPEVPAPDLGGIEAQVSEKLESLRAAVVEDPSDFRRWFEYGRCLQAHDMPVEARACYVVSAEDEELAFESHYLTGILLRTRDREAAAAAFARAAALRDDYLALHVNLGELAEEMGAPAEATRHFEKALALDASSSHALLGLGRIALAAGDAATARERLERAAKAAPEHKQVHAVLAAACRQLGDTDAARRHAARAERIQDVFGARDPIAMEMHLTSNSLNSLLQIARAAVARSRPRPELALHYADRAIAIRDDLSQPHYTRSRALYLLDRLPEALISLERVIAIEPDHVEALGNAGGILISLERPTEAARYLRRALELDPTNTNALYLSSLLIWRTMPGEAESMVRRALETDPEDVPARLHLATILAAVGKIDDAESELRRALRTAPGHPRAKEMLAKLLRERKP